MLILAVWIIYSCIVLFNFIFPIHGLPLFSSDLSDFYQSNVEALRATFTPPLLSIFTIIVIPLFIGALLMRDERLKAYFGKGKFVEPYRTYKAMRRSGEKPLPNPWIAGQKS
jgi:hypothetical protein